MNRRVFISHKNTGLSNDAGGSIGKKLKDLKHTVFFDKFDLEAGMNWNNEIIRNLIECDVLIVVVDAKTAESDWVQREIDMARAQSISILPVILEDFSNVKPAFERFDIEQTQFFHFEDTRDLDKLANMLNEIANRIEPLANLTGVNQEKAYEAWKIRRRPKKTPGNRKIAHTFTHPDAGDVKFHLTSGDASLTREFEILVNTENNYMQMARFFETSTLSYAIRKNGAYIEDNVRLVADTIQEQLYQYATNTGELPVRDKRVLITSSGHTKSKMKRLTDFKYILHACAVKFEIQDGTEKALPIEPVSDIIANCLMKVADIDEDDGLVALSSEDVIVPSTDGYEKMTSILFPVFGSGNGGKAVVQAIRQIAEGFTRTVPTIIRDYNLAIQHVGLSIFAEEDVDSAHDIFIELGFEEV